MASLSQPFLKGKIIFTFSEMSQCRSPVGNSHHCPLACRRTDVRSNTPALNCASSKPFEDANLRATGVLADVTAKLEGPDGGAAGLPIAAAKRATMTSRSSCIACAMRSAECACP